MPRPVTTIEVRLATRNGSSSSGRLIFLPLCSPELNPVENIWQYLRANWLSNRVFDSYDDIIDAASDAWSRLADQPKNTISIGTRQWAHIGQA